MLKTIPHVAAERSFALKGGTAINLFVRDMPRLSLDIDLTYLPVGDARDAALRNMSAALDRIAGAIKKSIPGTRVQETRAKNPDRITRITVAVGSTRIKIEPNSLSSRGPRSHPPRRRNFRTFRNSTDTFAGRPLRWETLRCIGPSTSARFVRRKVASSE